MDLLEKSQQSRERVLSRIRASLDRVDGATIGESRQALGYLKRHPIGPRPVVSPEGMLARFMAQSARLSATVELVPSRAALPERVASFLSQQAIELRAVAWPAFSDLDWARAGLDVAFRAPVRDEPRPDLVGITGCFAAVAETGTLALCSGPDTPASMALLPETHIAVVETQQVVPHMEDVFERVRAAGGMPRALNFVSGPSRTADIEQTLVLGAHGPYRVHLMILETSA